jgi:hypothetical protein
MYHCWILTPTNSIFVASIFRKKLPRQERQRRILKILLRSQLFEKPIQIARLAPASSLNISARHALIGSRSPAITPT